MEVLLFLVLFSVLCGMYANKLNRNGFGYFILSLFLTPLFGFVLLFILGENKENIVKNSKSYDIARNDEDDDIVYERYRMEFESDINTILRKVINFYSKYDLEEYEHNTDIEKMYTNGKNYFILKKINNSVVLELYNLPKFRDIKPVTNNSEKLNIDDLVKLGELLDKGVLTKEEFEAQKAKLLNA
ncbi:SHOCT domain-containing protein [Sulfurospirillum sp. UCH001]|uniref:SHOCT domain-containing protein n=1 Tax=Sulfurospirillum sp. UCH001 TaxID=1581011 RepID=UPI00082D0A7B|nr:SHOCT domain-containing protein [Sulfurospirillum sp. UCH001]